MLSPFIQSFIGTIGAGGRRFGQLFLTVQGAGPGASGFEIRHVNDVARHPGELRGIGPDGLRELAQHTASGEFRPLKSAPNLADGWCCVVGSAAELEDALNCLYPGAIPDWAVVEEAACGSGPNRPMPVTSFREFMGRQTGIYRAVRFLTDTTAARAIRSTCHPGSCLRRRLWSVDGLEPDGPGDGKSEIPCLEPCAILLDSARRFAVEEKNSPNTHPPKPV